MSTDIRRLNIREGGIVQRMLEIALILRRLNTESEDHRKLQLSTTSPRNGATGGSMKACPKNQTAQRLPKGITPPFALVYAWLLGDTVDG